MSVITEVIEHLNHVAGTVEYFTSQSFPKFRNLVIKLDSLDKCLGNLCKSYEMYCAHSKPKEEWDEYDHMMYPIWLEFGKIVGYKLDE